jgi:hypothetical protein
MLVFDQFPEFDSENTLTFSKDRGIKNELKKKISYCLNY